MDARLLTHEQYDITIRGNIGESFIGKYHQYVKEKVSSNAYAVVMYGIVQTQNLIREPAGLSFGRPFQKKT